MASANGERKVEKSYLASAVDSINPWAGSRTSTPLPKEPQPAPPQPSAVDHAINPYYGQSFKKYPLDCPPLKVQWFHAVDVPKRKPKFLSAKDEKKDDQKKPTIQPKKFATFSPGDSRALEAAYQKKLEEIEAERASGTAVTSVRAGSKRPRVVSGADIASTDGAEGGAENSSSVKVPVNEDFLFDVNIDERELGPVYWEGPVYEIRRGSWFYQEGSTLRACEENLAAQLEEGYLKVKPWTYPPRLRSNSGPRTVTPKSSFENLRAAAASQVESITKTNSPVSPHQPQTHRLFGAHMNSVATYQDASVAWLSSDGVLSWVTSTVYERFAGGGYMSGVKLVRGYTEPKKAREEKRPMTPTGTLSASTEEDEKLQKALKRRSAPPSTRAAPEPTGDGSKDDPIEVESTANRLTRQLSNMLEGPEDPEAEEEAIRKREEKEMLDDYNARLGESQGREIEHVVLVTHGIGQLLGKRMESVNFVHDVNTLRKTIKSVYSVSDDLRGLNSEAGEKGPGNCRVQVLPVVWRHLLDFPKRRQKRRERDLGDAFNEEDEYPSLQDITVEGMAFARSLISDLALDVLLYQSGYREQITEIVLKESNRIFRQFKERNPEFKGKVHIMGHSLGSAIMFDILCRQREKSEPVQQPRNPLRFWPSQDRYESKDLNKSLEFEFDVADFYCLGSPIGLFQMLKGRTIAARGLPEAVASMSPLNPEYTEDPFLSVTQPNAYADERVSPITGHPFNVSSPKVNQLFNIFHPSDPIAYRLEPLVSTAMSSLKPQQLPYTKKGFLDSVTPQGLTGIGAKVGQSVSGLWSNLSAGIASNLLNRSLGLTQQDVARINAQQQHDPSPGAGTNIGGGVISDKNLSDALRSEKTAERQRQLAARQGGLTASGNEQTLLDDDLETLFSKFQKNRLAIVTEKGLSADTAINVDAIAEEEEKAAKMRREEMKARALNRNGRVDYCIQESVLDFNPINTIASHMSYWADEDVSHFVLSQMLANKVKTPGPKMV
ncbi:DDHD domain-containing protein [Cercophora newfieldiana]|uniref:DDHD domain-containing protein n=1 Tax=Cercophora newfieldiana TaxID=92897 RepID=A0AA39Y1Q3_9PEZI|nr:DDHD domain-containing protein [Cercophora newfieldiana]